MKRDPSQTPLPMAPTPEILFRLERLRRRQKERTDLPSTVLDALLPILGAGAGAAASGREGWGSLLSPPALIGGGAGLVFGPIDRYIRGLNDEVNQKSMENVLKSRIGPSINRYLRNRAE